MKKTLPETAEDGAPSSLVSEFETATPTGEAERADDPSQQTSTQPEIAENFIESIIGDYRPPGFFGSLKMHFSGVLNLTRYYFRVRIASDGPRENVSAVDRAIRDLIRERPLLASMVRAKIEEGYLVRPVSAYRARRPIRCVHMFKFVGNGIIHEITVEGDGTLNPGAAERLR